MRGRSSELPKKQLRSPSRTHQIRQVPKFEVQIPLNESPSSRPLISVREVQVPREEVPVSAAPISKFVVQVPRTEVPVPALFASALKV
mgnify:CR=1 FL=1